ncbi:MAG: hypothetical protein VYE22_28795 [Myxococcota bacterium]|nr:hypothetical protein [Myxococcota bacterium]
MRHLVVFFASSSLVLVAGCFCSHDREDDAGVMNDRGPIPLCERMDRDTDGDGIIDLYETDDDFDGDGDENLIDLDSDGDGNTDEDERGHDGLACTRPRNCDTDMFDDYLDLDSDDDGLPDGAERMAGTDACLVDSDGDGCSDLDQVGFGGCDPAPLPVYSVECHGASTEVTITLPDDAAVELTDEVALALAETDGYLPFGGQFSVAAAVSASHPDGGPAGDASGATFTNVRPGATLTFTIRSNSGENPSPPTSVVTLRALANGDEVATSVAVFSLPGFCPILI